MAAGGRPPGARGRHRGAGVVVLERGVMLRRRIGFVIGLASAFCLSGCRGPDFPAFNSADYLLEVVNSSAGPIRLQVAMIDGEFQDFPRVGRDVYSRTDVFEMNVGSRRAFAMRSEFGRFDSPDDGGYVRGLGAVYFYDRQAHIPYRGYVYLGLGCGVEHGRCGVADDDGSILHRSLDGTTESLFYGIDGSSVLPRGR